MKLQTQPEKWQCAVTSFAMAMDMPVERLIQLLGHDGSAVIFPEQSEPRNRRGHSIYELIRKAIDLNCAVTPIPLHPSYRSNSNEFVYLSSEEEDWDFFKDQINSSRGVIECAGPRGNHMIAYYFGKIFDPRGVEFLYTRESCEAQNLYTFCLWRFDWI